MSDPIDRTGLGISSDGYLLQKVIHMDCIKREINLDNLNLSFLPKKQSFDGRDFPDTCDLNKEQKRVLLDNISGDESKEDAFYIIDMTNSYNRIKPGDRFFWYNDIRPLSGSAGYLWIRDEYVWGQKVVWRS